MQSTSTSNMSSNTPPPSVSTTSSSSRCCLITGGTGFVGLNLIERILTQGCIIFDRICIVTRCKNGTNVQNIFQYLPTQFKDVLESRIEVIECDLSSISATSTSVTAASTTSTANGAMPVSSSNSSSPLHEALKHIPTIDVIFHLLHINEMDVPLVGKKKCYYFGREFVNMGHQPECRQLHYDLNLQCMDIIIDVASQKHTKRLIYCSSWSSYGVQPIEGTIVNERSIENDVIELIKGRRRQLDHHKQKPESKEKETMNSSIDDCGNVSDDDLIKFVERKQPKIALSFFGLHRETNPYSVTKHCCELKLRIAILSGKIKGGMTIQPTTILGMYSKYHWSKLFHRLLETNGQMPGIPGSTSVVDVRNLTQIMVQCGSDDIPCPEKEGVRASAINKTTTNNSSSHNDDDDNNNSNKSTFGTGECYVVGGENISNLGLMQIMAKCVNVTAPQSTAPKWLLMILSRWNEFIVTYTPRILRHLVIPRLLVKPKLIGSPFTTAKMCQSQKTNGSIQTISTFGYHPTPIQDIVQSNYEWLRKVGEL